MSKPLFPNFTFDPSLFKKNSQILRATREFFYGRGYDEVITPVVVPSPGAEVHLNFFETYWIDHRGKTHKKYMRTSPELAMKSLLALETQNSETSLSRLFQVGPCFRNCGERESPFHHPEFQMLEWYGTHLNLEGLMRETEDFLFETASRFQISCPKKFPRVSVYEAFDSFVGIPLHDQDSDLKDEAMKRGYPSIQESDDFETTYYKLLIDVVEPALKEMGAVILYDYPPSQASLAQVEGGRAKRFEIYWHGIELCNGFQELVSEEENIKRWESMNIKRQQLGKDPLPRDLVFEKAIKTLPECSGNALGLDRWTAILLGCQSFDDMLFFRSTFSQV